MIRRSRKKLVIFSVWDSGQNNPKAVEEGKQVKLLHKGDKVRTGRFGGEGTGGQSFLDYDWKPGDTYKFLVAAKANGDRTEYAGYFRAPDDKEWTHMVTFSTVTGGKNLGGYYSFVEDFKRDKVSTTKTRTAEYGNAWVKAAKGGEWKPVTEARFTADANPVLNIDAGLTAAKDRFFLSTGGEIVNKTTKLRDKMTLPTDAKPELPKDLPKVK